MEKIQILYKNISLYATLNTIKKQMEMGTR